MTNAFRQGYSDYLNEISSTNPFKAGTEDYEEWRRGQETAKIEEEMDMAAAELNWER